YLASPEGELYFALLSDWTDAPSENAAGDAALLDTAVAGIERLNRLHGTGAAGDRFLLLHRRRVWSDGQKRWMGWERKRGKLQELNQLLRGATDTTFLHPGGRPPAVPPDVRYVITLDADTRLPRETALRLVGKMAHPLNQPRFDAASGDVREGYAVLQPRVAPSLPVGREGSLFQRVFSSASGIDPYSAAVSDVYQDLFSEGSYAGKGIYDIDAFDTALAGRVPEDTLLSHDLFEGIFARAGLVSDVEVVEEFPSRYDVAAARQHRWARGAGINARSHLRALGKDAALAASQFALLIVLLAHQAWLMVDAIGRTLVRLLVTRRNLLQWVTAAQANLSSRLDLGGAYRRMSGGVAIGVAAAVLVEWLRPDAWWVAAPFVILWIASPAVAVWISRSPLVEGRLTLSNPDARALRLVARRTWRYFETFVTADDHMLPPDNFQEDPRPVLAHRTSPTNLGLYLLSAVSARDFGWAGTLQTVERLEATLATMSSLQRFRGHFYNWYDTRDLRPLDPRYVSSVDSGNLAAHLLALANACREWIDAPLSHREPFAGIDDALTLAREALRELPADQRTQAITHRQVEDALDVLASALGNGTAVSGQLAARLAHSAAHAATLVDIARVLAGELSADAGADILFWAEATQGSIESWRRDVAQTDEQARSLKRRLANIELTARAMAEAMQFGFLLDAERRLLSVGYRTAEGALDPSCYDLLASEARLASF